MSNYRECFVEDCNVCPMCADIGTESLCLHPGNGDSGPHRLGMCPLTEEEVNAPAPPRHCPLRDIPIVIRLEPEVRL